MRNNIFKIGLIISIIIFLIGLCLFLKNRDFIEYTTYFGEDKAGELSNTVAAFGYSGQDYSNMSEYGNKAIIGIGVICISLVVLLISYLVANNIKLVNNSNKQVDLLQNVIENSVSDVSNQLRELKKLKEEGVLSEEEYASKKQELLSKL